MVTLISSVSTSPPQPSKVLLGQQDLDEALKLATVGLGKAGVVADVLLDDRQPFRRKRRGPAIDSACDA